jgi:L-fuculose-phosphate aldolase
VCGEVGFVPYALPGSAALGNVVADTFEKGFDCVIMENHGTVTAGATFQEAFRRFETLEFTAKTLIKAKLLGGEVRYLTDEQVQMEQQRVGHLEEFIPEAPSSQENEVRQRLCEFVRRAYRQRLFISTQGSFSARVSANLFLITPSDVDRANMQVSDLVLIKDGRAEAGKPASKAAGIHQEIYRRHPEIASIINAYPVNATAFSVTGVSLHTTTIPESYVVVRNVGRAPYGVQFEDGRELAKLVAAKQPALILENDGVLVTGSDILEAFDRLEVLESTAEAIINCRAVGAMQPMSDSVTRDLDAAFFGEG